MKNWKSCQPTHVSSSTNVRTAKRYFDQIAAIAASSVRSAQSLVRQYRYLKILVVNTCNIKRHYYLLGLAEQGLLHNTSFREEFKNPSPLKIQAHTILAIELKNLFYCLIRCVYKFE